MFSLIKFQELFPQVWQRIELKHHGVKGDINDKKDYFLKMADEAREENIFDLELYYLHHAQSFDLNDFDIYERIIKILSDETLNMQCNFKSSTSQKFDNYYTNFLAASNKKVMALILQTRIVVAKNGKSTDKNVQLIEEAKQDTANFHKDHNHKIGLVYLFKDNALAENYFRKIDSKSQFYIEANFFIGLIKFINKSYFESLKIFEDLLGFENSIKLAPLIYFYISICEFMRYQDSQTCDDKFLVDSLKYSQKSIECLSTSNHRSNNLINSMLNLKLLLLNKIKSLPNVSPTSEACQLFKRLYAKMKDQNEKSSIYFENKISLTYLNQSFDVIFKEEALWKKVEDVINHIEKRANQRNLDLCEIEKIFRNKNIELYFYYKSIFLFFKSESSNNYQLRQTLEPYFKYEKLYDDLKNLANINHKYDNALKSHLSLPNYLHFIGTVYLNSDINSETALKYFERAFELTHASEVYFRAKCIKSQMYCYLKVKNTFFYSHPIIKILT